MKTFLAILVFVLLLSVDAKAQQNCMPHQEAINRLQSEYQETLKGFGISNGGRTLMEVLTSEKGTWTILITPANKWTCIATSGQDWTDINAEHMIGNKINLLK